MRIRLASPLQPDSIVDGAGIRTVIWTQGCGHHCPGCHNPETHDFDKGFEVDIEEIKQEISKVEMQDGITLSGGDPFFQIEASNEIAKFAKEQGLNVWAYTGFTFEKLYKMSQQNETLQEFLDNIDVLVDGRFEQDKKSLNLHFRGSTNQRILDVKESMLCGQAIEMEQYDKKEIWSAYSRVSYVSNGIYI